MTDQPRDFEAMLSAMRPTLHRYCARMTGSVVDGEDVVQDALLKALMARETVGPLANPEAGSSASPTTRRSTFCVAASGSPLWERRRTWP
jgi:hypothetical protein